MEKIQKECKPMIEMIKKSKYNFVYRSSSREYPMGVKRKVKGGRDPRFIDKELHDLLGKWSIEKFGWNTRKDGLFCGGLGIMNFGTYKYIVFPVGRFKYVVHPNVTTLWEYFTGGEWEGVDFDAKKLASEYQDDEFLRKALRDMRKEFDRYLDSKGLPMIMRRKSVGRGLSDWECIIKCKEYYAIDAPEYEDEVKEILRR